MTAENVSVTNEKRIPDFSLVPAQEKQAEKILRPSTTFLQDAWYRFSRNKLGILGAVIVICMVLFAVFGPIVFKADYITQDLMNAYQAPSAEHPFGTDALGRDLLVRMAYGARISLVCGFFASIVSLFVGVTYGAISGYVGGLTDSIMMRVVDIISAVPSMLYVILLMVVLNSQSLLNVFLVIGMTGWLGLARLGAPYASHALPGVGVRARQRVRRPAPEGVEMHPRLWARKDEARNAPSAHARRSGNSAPHH